MQAPAEGRFPAEELPGIEDFWRVYARNYDALHEIGAAVANADPQLQLLLRAMPAELIEERRRDAGSRIGKAMAGDYGAHAAFLQEQGALCARLGVAYSTWRRLFREIGRALTPLLVREFQSEPERLSRALLAMHSLHGWMISCIGEAYIDAKDAIIRERDDELATMLHRIGSVDARDPRSALLAVELALLNGVSEAVATHEDVDGALRQALAACFETRGIPFGALYLVDGSDLRIERFGAHCAWSEPELSSFFGDRELLDRVIATRTTLVLSAEERGARRKQRVLERAGAASGIVFPLFYKAQSFGALAMMSASLDMHSPDRVLFGQAVAGQIGQALAVTRALVEKQESERRAREQAAVQRSILDSIGDGVVVCDELGELICRNKAADRIIPLGACAGPLAQWSELFGVFEADQTTPVPANRWPLARAMRGEAVENAEIYVRNEERSPGLWISVNARPWRDDEGEIRGGVAAFRDITEDKAAQARLMVSDRMASVGMLAAGVAHEINTPLAAVLANLEIAQRELANCTDPVVNAGDLRDMIADARTAADRVRQIVRELRIFSRSEEVASGAVDVHAVLESSLRMAWNEIRHRAQVTRAYGEVRPAEASESRLAQVFLNLIVNAAQAIPEGNADKNSIRIATRPDPSGRIAVEVSDSGAGIPKELLPRLFTPFFTTKAPGFGTGLGLAICHRIVTSLGGEIQVESQLGKGTTFRVLLPPASAAHAEPPMPPPPSAEPAQRRARVLVVDDEAMIGTVVRRALGAEHDVVSTTQASDALVMIRNGDAFDVILCDLMMPQMTGMEFHAALVAHEPRLAQRIIFLTGGAFTVAARAFLDQVPNQRVDKPFDAQHLRALINDRVH